MEAQSFFSMCNQMIAQGEISTQNMTCFADDEEEFLDEDFNNVSELELQLNESSVRNNENNSLKGVTVPIVVQSSSPDNIQEYFFYFLKADNRNVVHNDILKTWNLNYLEPVQTASEALREFILMLFGIQFSRDTDYEYLCDLRVSDLSKIPASCFALEPEEYESLLKVAEGGYNVWEYMQLARNSSHSMVLNLMQNADYDYKEACLFAEKRDVFKSYCLAKESGYFEKSGFEKAVDNGTYADYVYLRTSGLDTLLKLVSHRALDMQLFKSVVEKDENISKAWVEKYKDCKYLDEILKARYASVADEKIEELLLQDDVSDWFAKKYAQGKLDAYDGKTEYHCFVLRSDMRALNLELPVELNENGAKCLIENFYMQRMSPVDYKIFLMCISKNNEVLQYIDNSVVSFNALAFSKVISKFAKSVPISQYIGSALIIVTENRRIHFYDTYAYLRNYADIEKLYNSAAFSYMLLNNNAGLVLYHVKCQDIASKLLNYSYPAPNSVELWAGGRLCDTDVERTSLYILLQMLPKSCHAALAKYKECAFVHYQSLDRCFSYVVTKYPSLKKLFLVEDVDLVLRSLLSAISAKSKGQLLFVFLKTLLRSLGKLELYHDDQPITEEKVRIVTSTMDNVITYEAMLNGFSGLYLRIVNTSKVLLGVSHGKIFLKLEQ